MHLNDKGVWTQQGLCYQINSARRVLGIEVYHAIHHYTEFNAYRPKIMKDIYWWPRDPDDPNRERVLRECIEKTKP